MFALVFLGRSIGNVGFRLSALVLSLGVLYSNLIDRQGFLPPTFYLGLVGVVVFGTIGLLSAISIRGGVFPRRPFRDRLEPYPLEG
jgi:hypothetical protein